MPSSRYGGPLPDVKYGFELTVEPPDGTSEAQPVRQGELFKLGGTAGDGSGYKAVACTAADTPTTAGVVMLMAKHDLNDSVQDLGVKLISADAPTVVRLPFEGTAPTVGQSIAISGANVRRVTGAAFGKGNGRIMRVNTSDVEVLLV
jgi:hypothetical protein